MMRRSALGALGCFLAAFAACFVLFAELVDSPRRALRVRRNLAAMDDAPLYLHWVRQLPPAVPAWPEQAKLQFDAAPVAVASDGLIFLGSTRTDNLTAYDAETGAEMWHFVTNGPVRLAPAVWKDNVYCVSDDGYLYCLDAGTGRLLWKFRGGPSDRLILGNDRLISTWPARGGPVVADGTVYFAAGIWPFMGIFLHALDAETGAVIWTNDGDGCTYMPQPHGADSFAGVAPQGQLVVAGESLLVPGGRSVPACYDRATGKQKHFKLAERGGGSAVHARGGLYLNGGGAFDVKTGRQVGNAAEPCALTDDLVYCTSAGEIQAYRMPALTESYAPWTLLRRYPLPGVQPTALVCDGKRLLVGAAGKVIAFEADATRPTAPRWEVNLQGTPAHLHIDEGRLFVTTHEGRLYCFAPGRVPMQKHGLPPVETRDPDTATEQAEQILRGTGVRAGWAVVWGAGDGGLVRELVRQSDLCVAVLEPDAEQAAQVRDQLCAAGIFGDRAAVLVAAPERVELPPYFASLMVAADFADAGITDRRAFIPRAFQSLRPYGGVACLALDADEYCSCSNRLADLPQAQLVTDGGPLVRLIREGPLPGAADWTHEHADAANTRVGQDTLVKAPLGVLWYGGPTHSGLLPRHGHGPQPQVIEGRSIILGPDLLRAIDIYTGRLLWEARLPGVGKDFDETWHQPGANGSGTNFISTRDGIYVVHQDRCLRLDPATGKTLATFGPPAMRGEPGPLSWGYLNVAGDYLIGGVNPPRTSRTRGDTVSASKHLFVLDRRTGQRLWSTTSRSGFRHNAICAGGGRLFAIDRAVSAYPWRRDESEVPARLVTFDLRTGKERWSSTASVFGTWLSYSAKRDILVESGNASRDTLGDEAAGMRAWQGTSGRPLWHQPGFAGPAMLHGDTILKDRSACDLRTGAPVLRTDPLTGQVSEWTWTRDYGCNTPLASQHLLTFRSGAAGFFDLANDGGTGNFGGFRSGCTNNLIVAGGVLVAPDYTRTCTCSYQNQTSVALVPMVDAEMWTYSGTRDVNGIIRRVGISFGAPGSRKADDGTLWLEHPRAGGPAPRVSVATTPANPDFFRRHTSWVQEGELPWVTSSGVKGLTAATITLGPPDTRARAYTVKLRFIEPDGLAAGERRFDVALQGQPVLRDFDIAQEAGAAARGLVKEFRGVRITKDLTVTLTPAEGSRTGQPVLCGVEVMAEGW